METIIQLLAAVFGLASAAVWSHAAIISLPSAAMGGPAPDLLPQLRRQGKLNGLAALLMALSVLFQWGALVVWHLFH